MKKVLAMIILALFAVNTTQIAFADDLDSTAPTYKTSKKYKKKKSKKKKKGSKSKKSSKKAKKSKKGRHSSHSSKKSKRKSHRKAAAPVESSDAAMAVPSSQGAGQPGAQPMGQTQGQ